MSPIDPAARASAARHVERPRRLAIPRARSADVVAAAEAREMREGAIRDRLRAGAAAFDVHGWNRGVDASVSTQPTTLLAEGNA